MIILILTRGNNAGSLLEKMYGIKLSSEINLSNLFFHRSGSDTYVIVRIDRYNSIEMIIGLSIARRIILVFGSDNGDTIYLLERVKDYLNGKSIITCVDEGINRNSVESTQMKLQNILPNTFLSDIIDLSEGYDELRSLIEGDDYDNQILPIREIILNRLTHAGLGRGYEVVKLEEDTGKDALTQKSIHIGCIHGNNSLFLSSDEWSGNPENLPILIPEKGDDIELGCAPISGTGKGMNFNIYSNDWLKVINIRNLILEVAKARSCRNNIAFLNLDIKREHRHLDTIDNLHNICLDIKGISFSSWVDLYQYCDEFLRRDGLSLIPVRSRVKVLKVFEKVSVGKTQRRIIGCRLINGSFGERDLILVNDRYYRIDQVWSGQERLGYAETINNEYGLLLDREDFNVNQGLELIIHEQTYGEIIQRNQGKGSKD